VIELQRDYATAHAQGTLGKVRETIDRIVAIADAADDLGYRPLAAEALAFVGRAEIALGDPRAVPTLPGALASIAGADDRQSAATAIDLYAAAVRKAELASATSCARAPASRIGFAGTAIRARR
jgi:hypothetical protein